MALFPQGFVDDLKAQTDIVSLINEVTPLRKAGASWKGLCPFHQEKTASFNVHPDKGFFKCFGCDAKGDVFKFVELNHKLAFPDAVRFLAQRAGMPVPETEGGADDRAAASEREALVKLHEQAAEFFRQQLDMPAGARARRELERRGLSKETIQRFGYGYAPAGGRDTLLRLFEARGVPRALQLRSGLIRQFEDGPPRDHFKNRLMIPIARDSGSIVAFGGRALEPGQNPKYVNSPETPIYTKGRILYGLDVTKGAVRTHNYSVLVEGYFDLAQVWQAGVQSVVALCGTALTTAQARTLKRFTSKVVLSLDPDAAGRGAAARSSELLVSEGFHVNVALLPEGSDPDAFIQKAGAHAYVERLTGSRPYLEFLLDRAAAGLEMGRADHRKTFLDSMLTVASTIPDAATRDQFADRLAHRAQITESVVRDEILKAAARKQTTAPVAAVPPAVKLLTVEKGLIWALMRRPVEGLAAVAQLEADEMAGLRAASIFRLAVSLKDIPADSLPDLLLERLNEEERATVRAAAADDQPVAEAPDCVRALRLERLKRERAEIQRQIDALPAGGADAALSGLWTRKKDLLDRIEALKD